MCGVWTRTHFDRPVGTEELLHPVRSLWHRGPDDYRWFADDRVGMLHTRLSIIDLEGGAQPLVSHDQRWIGIVNGELYDYEEIRERLGERGVTCKTKSDSEVLLNLFALDGAAGLASVSGEFAFIFYDRLDRKIHFGRDPFGVKPLFFENRPGRFTLASEMKALSDETPVFDQTYVNMFLAKTVVPPRTCLEGVEHAWPGRLYSLDLNTRRLQSVAYHRLPLSQDRPLRGQEAQEAFEHEIRGAVKRRLRADVDVGCYLSGGVDSALIAALAADLGAKPHAFTAAFRDRDFDESREAARIAADLGLRHSTVEFTSRNFMESLLRSIVAFENPVGNPHGAAKNLLSSLARQHVKVVLTGEGADEWFGGYAYLRSRKIQDFAHHHPRLAANALKIFMEREGTRNVGHLEGGSEAFRDVAAEYFGGVSPALLGRLPKRRWFKYLTGQELDTLVPEICASLAERMNEEIGGDSPVAVSSRHTSWNTNTWVSVRTDLLHYILANVGDRQEMANSIEGRTPFLDRKVVSVACRISEQDLLSGLREKAVVRRTAAKYLRSEHHRRGKKPFFAPIKYIYLRENREALRHYIAQAKSATPWLPWRNIDHLLQEPFGQKGAALASQIISLQLTFFSLGVLHEKLRDHSSVEGLGGGNGVDPRPKSIGDLIPHRMFIEPPAGPTGSFPHVSRWLGGA